MGNQIQMSVMKGFRTQAKKNTININFGIFPCWNIPPTYGMSTYYVSSQRGEGILQMLTVAEEGGQEKDSASHRHPCIRYI